MILCHTEASFCPTLYIYLEFSLRALSACIKKEKDIQIGGLRFYFKKLQGGEQNKHK